MLALLLCALLADGQPLTLQQAFTRARETNAELRAARSGVELAERGVEVAGQLANPTLSVTAGADDPRLTAALDVKLPIFGQRGAAVAAAERGVPVARSQALAAEVRLRAEVRRAYFGLAAARGLQALAEEGAARAAELARLTGDKSALGSAARLEAEQAELSRKRAAQEVEARSAALGEGREQLALLLGSDRGGGAATAPPPDPIDPLWPLPSSPPLEEALAAAGRHPEVAGLDQQRLQALARADQERVAVRPLPDLSVAVENNSSSPSTALRAGIAFDLPLLSWNRGRVREQEAQAGASAAQAEATSRRLASTVRTLHQRLAAARRRALFLEEEALPAVRRVREMALQGWQLGRTSFVQLLLAEQELTAAQAQSLEAQAAAQRALADLEEASGVGF